MNTLNHKKLFKIASKFDKLSMFRESDLITNLLLKIAQNLPFDITSGIEENDPKTIMDYWMGYAFDLAKRKPNITQNNLELELEKHIDEKLLEISPEKLNQFSELRNTALNKDFILENLRNQDFYKYSEATGDMDQMETTKDPNEFISQLSSAAQSASDRVDNLVPASIILAMAAWESGWGKSKLAAQYGNYFGIKQSPTSDSDLGVRLKTFEYYDGEKQSETAEFATYEKNAISAMSALPNFLLRNPRYSEAIDFGELYKNSKSIDDLHSMIDSIFEAGYSTDPNEPQNIKKLISQYNLTQFD